MTDRAQVSWWLAEYERAWRTPGTEGLGRLFAEDEQEYRDLWIIQLGDDGRCREFEEWPYWPDRPYAPGGG